MARLLRAYPDHLVSDYTGDDIEAVLRTVPPRSRHIARSIYNQFFEWATLRRRIEFSPMGLVARVKNPRRRETGIFELAEVAALEALPSPDGQLFAILFGSGIRRAEARDSQRSWFDLARGRMFIDGKGGKQAVIPLTRSALQAVADLDLTEGLNPQDHLWATRCRAAATLSAAATRLDQQHDVRAFVPPLHRQGRCPVHEAAHHPAHLPRADEARRPVARGAPVLDAARVDPHDRRRVRPHRRGRDRGEARRLRPGEAMSSPPVDNMFWLGSVAGLEEFRAQLVADRGRIENELEPAVDVILDLLDRCIDKLRELEEPPEAITQKCGPEKIPTLFGLNTGV